jgi:hypothetical protein
VLGESLLIFLTKVLRLGGSVDQRQLLEMQTVLSRQLRPERYESVAVPERLQAFVLYAAFSKGSGPIDDVELMLTPVGVRFARADHARGSYELAGWLMEQPLWKGSRSQKNVADEISAHCLCANWPLISRRANPVNIEYFQAWPVSPFLQAWGQLKRALRLQPKSAVANSSR